MTVCKIAARLAGMVALRVAASGEEVQAAADLVVSVTGSRISAKGYLPGSNARK